MDEGEASTATITRPSPAASPTRTPRLLVRLLPVALLVLGWAVLLPGLRWYVNPDGGVYASLATQLADLRLGDAVAGYWSPLLPLLAAPLVALGVPALEALRLVLLGAAVLALLAVQSLTRRAGASEPAVVVTGLLAVPLLVSASLFGLYPELLLAALCLLVVLALLTVDGRRGAVLTGVAGGLAYLAKAVGLPFTVAMVVLVTAVRLVRPAQPRSEVLVRAALSLGTALLVSAPWVVAVSVQAGHPTLSTAGAFNARLVEPGAWGNPLNFPGLYRPEGSATTPWQDPVDLPVRRNAPFEGTPVTAADRLDNAVAQAKVGVGVLLRRWVPVLVLAAVGVAVAVRRRRRGTAVVLGGPVAAAVFAGGLALLILIERYLWFPMLAVLPAAGLALSVLIGRERRRAVIAGAGGLVLIAALQAPVVASRWGEDREVWRLADRSCGEGRTPPGPLAGTSDWSRTQLLAQLCGVDYVGLTDPASSREERTERLREVGAGALVDWDVAGGPRVQPVG